VDFHVNDGSGQYASIPVGASDSLVLPNPQKYPGWYWFADNKNYTFLYWRNADNTIGANAGQTLTSTELDIFDNKFYAVWQINSSEIVFSDRLDSTNQNILSFAPGTDITIPDPKNDWDWNSQKTGNYRYRFLYWESEDKTKRFYAGDKVSISQLDAAGGVLYAVWEKGIYCVVTVCDYKGNPTSLRQEYKVGETYGGFITYLKASVSDITGYVFSGIYNSLTGGSRITKDTVVTSTTDHNIYMIYNPITYNIVYKNGYSTSMGSGAYGTVPSQKVKYDEEVKLNKCTYTVPGYEFKEWELKNKGVSIGYKEGEEVKNLSSKSSDTVTFTAKWVPLEVNATLNLNFKDTKKSEKLIVSKKANTYEDIEKLYLQ
jgi:hypothetical protein